ncbi:MAG: hypothetical protein AB7O52_00960 [Planctomycetota bacterium]
MIKRGNFADSLREMLFGNWKNKGVALFLALVVWAYAFGATQEEQSFSTEVELRVKEAAFAVKEVRALRGTAVTGLDVNDPRFTVAIKLKGPRKLLRTFVEATIRGYVEVGSESQEYDLVQDLAINDLPQGVSIESVDPPRLKVLLEPIRMEVKEIQAQSRGVPDPSFRSKPRFDFSPSKLTLVGPESALAGARVVCEVLDVAGMTEPLERSVKVFVDGSDRVQIKDGERQSVTVRITLEDATEIRSIRVSVQFGMPPLDRQVAIEAASEVVIRFQGTKAALDQLAAIAAKREAAFHLLYMLEREDVSDDRVFSVLHDEFRWLQGEAPPGIRIVGFGEENPSYTVALSVKAGEAGN